MTFPTTTLLDSFSRADQDPIAGTWSGPIFESEDQLKLVSEAITGGSFGNSYWGYDPYGDDCEAWATITTKSPTLSPTSIFARVFNPNGSTMGGYSVDLFPSAGTDSIRIRRWVNSLVTQLGATLSQDVADGDQLGIECIGDQISAWYKPAAGSWTLVGTRTDATHPSAGYIGLLVDSNAVVDDFGGGTVAVIPPLEESSGVVGDYSEGSSFVRGV